MASILGYNTTGGAQIGYAHTYYLASHDTTDATGGVTDQLHIICRNTSGVGSLYLKMAIYTDDAGNNRPETQLAPEVEIEVPLNGGLVQTLAANYVVTLSGSTKYWLAWIGDTNTAEIYYDWEDANDGNYTTAASYSLPDTWPNTDNSNWAMRMSIWATYTPAAGGSIVPIAMHHYKQMRRN
jgi:hypothetical protein